MSLDQQFNSLHEKLQLLLKQHSRLQKENERLNELLQESRVREERFGGRISELEQKVSVLQMAAGQMNEKDKKEFEKKLSQYIKEVDRCISFLSDEE